MLTKMRYRLALDLGTTSLGWSMVRLNQNNEPTAIIKAGVRIFSDGRNPKDGTSLAVTWREARAMRRRRSPRNSGVCSGTAVTLTYSLYSSCNLD